MVWYGTLGCMVMWGWSSSSIIAICSNRYKRDQKYRVKKVWYDMVWYGMVWYGRYVMA